MFGQGTNMMTEHEILKENYEMLQIDYESLQERLKHVEETYELFKLQLQRQTKELEVKNANLVEDCVKERNEKEKFMKMFEDMKKTMEDERNAEIDELRKINQELLLANKKEEEELEKMEKKYVELEEKFSVVEAECAQLYDAEVAASGTLSAVMSGIGETENLNGQGENEVNHNSDNSVTDAIVLSDESAAEHENPARESNNISSHRSAENPARESNNISSHRSAENPARESNNISSHRSAENSPREAKKPRKSSYQSVDRSQEEQDRNIANENQASGEIFTPRSTNHPAPFTVPSSSSSSSSSSDGYEVVVKLPANWPEWASPNGPGNRS